MPTLDLWSNSANLELRQLFRSAMASLLLLDAPTRPIYICSPWISDFIVFENRFGEFGHLVPGVEERSSIRLSECLRQLAHVHNVRIISRRTDVTLGDAGYAQDTSSTAAIRRSMSCGRERR